MGHQSHFILSLSNLILSLSNLILSLSKDGPRRVVSGFVMICQGGLWKSI